LVPTEVRNNNLDGGSKNSYKQYSDMQSLDDVYKQRAIAGTGSVFSRSYRP